MSQISEQIRTRQYLTGIDLVPHLMKSGSLLDIILMLSTCQDQNKIKDTFFFIKQIFSTEVMQKLDEMQIDIPSEVLNFIQNYRSSQVILKTSDITTSPESDYQSVAPLKQLPDQLESILNKFSTEYGSNLVRTNNVIAKCLSRSIDQGNLPDELNNKLTQFGWFPLSKKFSSSLNLDQLRSLISVLHQILSPTTITTHIEPRILLQRTSQTQIPPRAFSNESLLYHQNDWLVNRPLSEDLSPVVRFIDVLRHRMSLKSYSPLQVVASSATDALSQHPPTMRLTLNGGFSQQRQPQSSQLKADNTVADPNNTFNATYDILIHLIQKSHLLSQIMLYQLLIERRLAVPILTPNPPSADLKYSFHINALTFTSTRLSREREVNLSLDVELPRVVVISMRSIDQMESISWISELFSCRSAAHYTQENIRCILPEQCVAELGIGAFPRYKGCHSELIVDEKAPRVELLILNVIGDYKPIIPFIVQFGDILLVEETPDSSSHFKPPSELSDRCFVVTWKSDSNRSTDGTTDSGENHLSCTLKKTVKGVRYFIQRIIDEDQEMKNKGRLSLTNFQFASLYQVHALNFLGIDLVIKEQDYTQLRTGKFQLQKLFVEEAAYHKKKNENQSDLAQIQHAQQKINELTLQRRNKASQSASNEFIKYFLDILQQKDPQLRAIGMYRMAQQLEFYCERALASVVRKLEEATNQYKKNQTDEGVERSFFEAKKAYSDSITRVEHLWRELSHLYAADPVHFSYLADLGAQHLLDGFPLELLDGDAGLMEGAWIRGVFTRLNTHIMQSNNTSSVRILVISVLGVQSTGKSTLLNHMFGTWFRTSAGQCTRGVYMQLIRCENRPEYDYTLILDTEGMRAPEFTATGSAWHDNRLASFSILPADVSIVLINNEEDTAVREIIPIVLLTYQQNALAMDALAQARNKLVFVFMRNDQNAKSELKSNKDALFINLRKAAADIQQKYGGERLSSSLLDDFRCDSSSKSENDEGSDIKSIGKLKKSDIPPNDVPDKEYGRAVVSLLEYIHQRVVTGSEGKWKARTLTSFIDYMNMVWQCIDSADFTLSFKTVQEKWSYESLQQ